MLHDSFAASLGPLLPQPSHPSPLVVKLGNSFHPQGLGQFREGWENLLNRVAEARSRNRLYRAVLSPPSRPVPLLPHRAEAAASRNQPFYYAVGGLGSVEGRGTGGGVMPESPGACGEDTTHQAL